MVGSIISAVTLAAVAVNSAPRQQLSESDAAIFPLIISAIGIIASVIGILLVRGKEGGNPASAFKYGTYISARDRYHCDGTPFKSMLGDYTLRGSDHRRLYCRYRDR